MTPEEIAALKRLAEAANLMTVPAYSAGWFTVEDLRAEHRMGQEDAAYVAALDPATILRLIAHAEGLPTH